MPSTYTTNLGLEKPATGEQAGVWGVTANNSYDFIDMSTDGWFTVAVSQSGYTLLTNQGTPSNGRNKVIIFTGALTADATITIAPNTAQKIYFIQNKTTGGFNLIIGQGTGTSYTLAMGYSAAVYADGAGNAASVKGVLTDLQVDTLLVKGALTYASTPSFANGATFSAPVTLNLGGDAAYDTYYRGSAGALQRLAIGAAGQSLVATATGPQWQTVSVGVGSGITGSTPWEVFYANGSSQLAQSADFQFVPGTGVGIGMVPSSGLCIGKNQTIQLDGAVASQRQLLITTAGKSRWQITTTADTEPGSNAGCSLVIASYNDAGTASQYAFSGFRNGRMTFGAYYDFGFAQVHVANNQATSMEVLCLVGASGQAANMQSWRSNNNTMLARCDASGNFYMVGLNVTNAATINNPTFTGTITGLPVTGIPGMMVQVNGGTPIGPYTYFNFQNAGAEHWAASTAAGSPGNNTCNIQCATPSDVRLKQNIQVLQGGLNIIEQLRPVEFEWNGLASMTQGRRGVNLIAQELQRVLPGAVETFRDYLQPEDAKPTELFTVNSTEVIMHLILAVQELAATLRGRKP